jgi:uncharacterized protein (TIRG00374 family)
MTRAGTFLKLAVSVSFLALVGLKTDWAAFLAMLGSISPLYLALSLATSVVMIVSSCLKWQLMLHLQGARPGFPYLMKTYLIGYFFNVLLPSNIGGDVVRSYYAGREVGDQYTAAVSVFLERFTGLVLLLLLCCVTPLLQPELLSYWRVAIPLGVAIFTVLLLLLISLNTGFLHSAGEIVSRFGEGARARGKAGARGVLGRGEAAVVSLVGQVVAKSETFSRKLRLAAGSFRHHGGYLAGTVLLTVFFYVATWFNVLFAFRTFNIDVRMLDIVSLLPLAMLISMLPVTLGGLGLVEGAYVFYFALAGVPTESGLIMGLFLRFKLLLTALAGLAMYLAHRHTREEIMTATTLEEL